MAKWELHDGKDQTEPHDEAHVLRMIAQGLPASTMVRAEGEQTWRPIGTHAPFAQGIALLAAPVMPAAPARRTGKRVSKVAQVGWGCFVQLAGVFVFFSSVGLIILIMGDKGMLPGFLVGVVLLVFALLLARVASTKWTCGVCANPIANSEVRICPACQAELS